MRLRKLMVKSLFVGAGSPKEIQRRSQKPVSDPFYRSGGRMFDDDKGSIPKGKTPGQEQFHAFAYHHDRDKDQRRVRQEFKAFPPRNMEEKEVHSHANYNPNFHRDVAAAIWKENANNPEFKRLAAQHVKRTAANPGAKDSTRYGKSVDPQQQQGRLNRQKINYGPLPRMTGIPHHVKKMGSGNHVIMDVNEEPVHEYQDDGTTKPIRFPDERPAKKWLERVNSSLSKSLFDGKAETVNDTKVRRNPSNPISADPWENWHMDKNSYNKHFKNEREISHLRNPGHEYVVQQARQDGLPVPQHYQGTGESLSNHQPTASQVKQSKQEAQQKEAYFKTPKGHAEEMAAMHERHRVIKDRARFGKSTSVRPLVVKSLFDGKPETHESLQHDVVPKTPAPPVKFTPPANYDKSRDYEYKNELGKMQTRRAQNKDIIHTYLLHPPATRQEQLHSNKAVREYNELTARIHAHPFNNRHETANAESRKRDTDDHWNEITAETEWLNKHQAHDKEKPQDIINRKNHMANYRFHSNASTGHGYYEPRPKEST